MAAEPDSEGMEDGGGEQAGNPGSAPRRQRRGKITPEDAVTIYLAQDRRTPRTATVLAMQYGITSKAVRDIWCEHASSSKAAAAVATYQRAGMRKPIAAADDSRSQGMQGVAGRNDAVLEYD